MSEESKRERIYHEISIENKDGSTSKILEIEKTGPIQVKNSDEQDRATVLIPMRVQTFSPITLNQELSLSLHREQIRKLAEAVGLIGAQSGDDTEI